MPVVINELITYSTLLGTVIYLTVVEGWLALDKPLQAGDRTTETDKGVINGVVVDGDLEMTKQVLPDNL